ncbi:hypothetical protein JOC93_001736 [Priestia taiwanensis]|nr:hypothetical protein [Priestia taiwanensis]
MKVIREEYFYQSVRGGELTADIIYTDKAKERV